jgi:phosphate transport system substrate-binding protein
MKKTFLKLLILSVTAIALVSCGGGKKTSDSENSHLSGDIKIDGSSTVFPITEAVAEDYKAQFPDVKVTVGLSGTGGGFKKFGRGEIDINDASRSIKSSEDSVCKANNITHLELKVAFDGLAVVVNPKNTWINDITVAELKMIWEPAAQGKIKYWNQIRPEWPKEEIHLFGAGVESGTYDYFTEAIVGKSHSSRGDYTASEDDNVLVQGISTDKLALGFFGIAYFEANKDKLKVVPVDDQKDENGKGPITPSIETVKNKTYAPLGRPLFIYVNSSAAKRPEVQSFVDFYLTNGGALSQEVGYIAMTDEEYTAEKVKFSEFVKALAK